MMTLIRWNNPAPSKWEEVEGSSSSCVCSAEGRKKPSPEIGFKDNEGASIEHHLVQLTNYLTVARENSLLEADGN